VSFSDVIREKWNGIDGRERRPFYFSPCRKAPSLMFDAKDEVIEIKQVHSCRSEDALAQKRCEIKAEGRGDGSKKKWQKNR
jgi:hypothetical protein